MISWYFVRIIKKKRHLARIALRRTGRMRKDRVMARFLDVFDDVTKEGHKIPKEKYLPEGLYPIIGQGQESIAGYSNDPSGLYSNVPAIIFGDHTRIIKYVDTPCFLGADGVKLLRAKIPDANYKYLYYALCSAKIPNTGYNRHYKWLKEIDIPLFSASEQTHIVKVLDKISGLITLRKQQLKKLDELVKSQFVEMFESKSWRIVRAGSIMTNMRNGVSPSNTGNIPAKVLTLSAITQGSFNPAAWKNGIFDVDPPIEKRVSASDFYICRGNGNKNLVGVGVYSKKDRYDLVFPDTAIAATVDLQKVCLPYLFHAWKRPSVREQIELGARTTNGTFKINQGVVSNIELILPPLELQKQFAALVQQVDKSKLAVQKGLQKLEILKNSLMQQYFA